MAPFLKIFLVKLTILQICNICKEVVQLHANQKPQKFAHISNNFFFNQVCVFTYFNILKKPYLKSLNTCQNFIILNKRNFWSNNNNNNGLGLNKQLGTNNHFVDSKISWYGLIICIQIEEKLCKIFYLLEQIVFFV